MSFTTPTPYNVTFKKYTTPTVKRVDFSVFLHESFTVYPPKITNKPNWITITNAYANHQEGYFNILLNKTVLNSMPAGTHIAKMQVSVPSLHPDGIREGSWVVGEYEVVVTIEDTVLLSVSPSTFSFSFTEGEAVPLAKELFIVSENSWQISTDASWVTLSSSSGVNSSTVLLGVDTAALDFGLYEDTVVVNDGFSTKIVKVYLTVNRPASTNDYLFVNPQNLEFLSQVTVPNNTQRNLSIDAGAPWSLTSANTWLVTSATSGAAGITDITITVDSASLLEGIYQSYLEITANGVIKKVYVVLRVVAYDTTGLVNNTHYYAEDRNKLTVGSVSDNSFLYLEISAAATGVTQNYTKEQPYFKGVATAVIGTEASLLIADLEPITNLVTGIKTTPKPLNISISAYEQNRFTGIAPNVVNYNNLFFLKGKTPKITNKLCYIPSFVVLPNTAKIMISVFSETDPGNIEITGAVTQTINGSSPNSQYIYAALVNLSQFNLSVSDEITITYGGVSVVVQIAPTVLENNTIAFENEWGVFEFFETRGALSQKISTNAVTTSVAINGLTRTKVIDTPETETYTINTGNLYSEEEVVWLSKILFSKRIYLYVNGKPLEVVLQNKDFITAATRRHTRDFNLTLKKAIE